MEQAMDRTPAHLWLVGGLATVWNAFGGYDYWMTKTENLEYLAQMGGDPRELLAWIDGFPIWAQFGWGLGVWMGLLGSALLLIRSRWAVHAFGLSLIGAVLGLGYQMANPMPGVTGFMATGMPAIIIAIAVALFLYARAQRASGVLR